MKQTVLMILAFGCFAVSPLRAHACFCVTPEVPDALKRAKAVFLGEVVDILEPRTSDENASLPGRFFIIKFKIQRSWKGIAFGTQEFSVLSAQGQHGCFAFSPVTKGETYLVYADPAFRSASWGIITICNRTTVVRFSSNPRHLTPQAIDPFSDIKQLDIITKPVFSFDRAPFSTARITTRLDRSGGSVFRIKPCPAKVEWCRAARSTLTLDLRPAGSKCKS